jgi:hypothetical protein
MQTGSRPLLRVKYLLTQYGKLFTVILIILSTVAFASVAPAFFSSPETEQVTEQTDVQMFKTTVNTSATVTQNTSLYESNRTLSNMPIYLLDVSPNLTVIAHSEVPADRPVELTQQITIELYATQNEEIFWSETRTIATDSERVTDGTLTTETTIDINETLQGKLSNIRSEIETAGVVQAELHVDAVYESEKYQGRLNVTTPMEITDTSYIINTPQSDERSHSTPVTRTVSAPDEANGIETSVPANEAASGGILSGIGSNGIPIDGVIRGGIGMLMLLAALVLWRLYGQLPDQAELKQEYDKVRYSDWISAGQVPTLEDYEQIHIEEFVDLIDTAIDSNKRVIYDQGRSLYAVVDGSCIYQYRENLNGVSLSQSKEGAQDQNASSPTDSSVTDGGTAPD